MESAAEILPGYPIETYLQGADSADWNADTLASYRRMLYELKAWLGETPPDAELLRRWQQELQDNGYRQHSINIRLSAANRYFRWCGRYDLLIHLHHAEADPRPRIDAGRVSAPAARRPQTRVAQALPHRQAVCRERPAAAVP